MEVHGKTRTFTYDANGNMLSDGKYTYSWTKGNLLEKVTGDGLEAAYTYDASGIRTVFCQALFPKKSVRIPCF